MRLISPATLAILRQSQDEWALFDVREPAEIHAGHIPNATPLPRRMIELQLAQLVQRRSTPIVLYDDGGKRAALASATLEELGYDNVSVLDGGTTAWIASGAALVEGKNVPSKAFAEEMFEHERVPQMTAEELAAKRAGGAPLVLCDIRAPDEHAIGHVPGAHNVPGVEIAAIAQDLVQRRETVIVHCAGRTRSILACQSLRALGVPDVYALKNGTMGWTLAGFELEREPGAPLPPTSQSLATGAQSSRKLAEEAGATAISPRDLIGMLEATRSGAANGYVFDVRQVDSYAQQHLRDSISLPGGQAVLFADDNVAINAAPIIFVDDGGPQAWMTAYWFKRLGYPRVSVLEGGIAALSAHTDPLETGRRKPRPLLLDAARAAVQSIDAAAAKKLLDAEPQATVVDVNTSKNFALGHIARSVWLPRGWLEIWSTDGTCTLGTPLLVACQNGLQSAYAARTLSKMGHPRVFVLEGGIAAWKKAGLALDKGKPDSRAADVVKSPYERTREDMVKYLDWEQKLSQKTP